MESPPPASRLIGLIVGLCAICALLSLCHRGIFQMEDDSVVVSIGSPCGGASGLVPRHTACSAAFESVAKPRRKIIVKEMALSCHFLWRGLGAFGR
ncbi:hypothetical protein AAFF_G00085540 [Aldrovandia affinis]|uniref:Uncharacterized protein n=1 Tax=Aldrovandia affinis TaxID=143900 RepID=A0AAD7WCA2_9TELE|nr:hypothetical protein AAFF_G00085540 [Aldrovandia affinis]